jgi:release factor glutamine methyltransferase
MKRPREKVKRLMQNMPRLKQKISVCAVKLIQRFCSHRVAVAGRTYVFSGHVFNPRFYVTSEFMAEYIQVIPEDEVMDIGTGSGIQAITAGETASKVIAIEINPEAARYAQENVNRNNLSHVVTVIQGDLFYPLSKQSKFDVILFTPPYFEGKVNSAFDHALYDPDKKLVARFFSEAKNFLKPHGYVQMVYSSIADTERVLKIAGDYGWRYRVIAEKQLCFETLFIYRLKLGSE